MRPLLLALASLALSAVSSAQQTPTFQSRVDVIPIDVGIFDSRGVPVQDLATSDFTVRINGQPRRVISAEWVPLAANRAETSSTRVPPGYTSNEQTGGGGGRLIVFAIDQPSIPFTAIRALQDAVNTFVDRLTPDDRIAVVGFGEGAPSVGFTTDRDRVKQAVARMPGQQRGVNSRHQLGLSPALSIDRDLGIDRDRPAGEYRLRATVTNGSTPLTTLIRPFELGPVIRTGPAAGAPAVVTATPAAPVDLAIAVEARDLTPPFRRDNALKPATVASFRGGMAPAAGPAFEKGLGHLQKGEYADAETSFRFAQRQDPGSIAALVYLAACLAAAGHDTEAANAWQTALARGSDAPEVYEWLGEALMRGRVFADARAVFEEAVERFPADSRFARPLALLYAVSGKGRDAVKTMERFLAGRADDTRSHFLVVQWIFNLHRGGAVVHDKGTDLQLARSSAARYLGANAPDQPLVKQWMDYLENEK